VTGVESQEGWKAANRRNWEERAAIHLEDRTGFYRIDRVRAGEDVLGAIEAAEIGDVRGKRLLHLQCHFGLDTLCLARRGATATGVDFSSTAIAGARALAAELRLAAEFVEADVYDARAQLSGSFDMVYVTWGAICWLPDIAGWARVVASLLRPGGSLYLADAHPSALAMEEIGGQIRPHYPWRVPADRPLLFEDAVTYTGDERKLTHTRSYEWIHPFSAVVNGILSAGLSLDFLNEHERLPWRLFPSMIAGEGGLFRMPSSGPSIPLSFSLRATRGQG
jgi:SAM-dependent methyltransferase